MPYTEQQILDAHDVISQAIQKWEESDPNHKGFGLSSSNLNLKQELKDLLSQLYQDGKTSFSLSCPSKFPTLSKLSSMLSAAFYAYARHCDPTGTRTDISNVDISPTPLSLNCLDYCNFVFIIIKLSLVSKALSLEDAISIATTFLGWEALRVGEQDNGHEALLAAGCSAIVFLQWLAGWKAGGKNQVEWSQASGSVETISLILKHAGTIGGIGALSYSAFVGAKPNTGDEVTILKFTFICAVMLQNNKAVLMQIGKGIDAFIHTIYVIFSIAAHIFPAIFGSIYKVGKGFHSCCCQPALTEPIVEV
jgi:hypothetical protein